MTVFISGKITTNDDDYDDVLIAGLPLIRSLARFHREKVFICWAFDANPISPEEFLNIAMETQEGLANTQVIRRWSEITGDYGWTHCEVGGHNIQRIFRDQECNHGALLISTNPLDLTTCMEAQQTISWFLEMNDG